MGDKQKGKGGRAPGEIRGPKSALTQSLSPSDGERLIWGRAPSLARAIALGNVGERNGDGVTKTVPPDYKMVEG